VSSFFDNAERIFEVARQSDEPEDLTIRIDAESGIHISVGPDYSSSSSTTYRVRRGQGRTQVEGRNGSQTCILQTEAIRRTVLADRPLYYLVA
jgi:hypothetical protein